MNGCNYLYDKIDVFEASNTLGYHENGRNF
jgi:hypothetical protein